MLKSGPAHFNVLVYMYSETLLGPDGTILKQAPSNEEKVPGIITDQEPSVQGCGSGSGSACMDPHSFSLLDPDSGGKI